MGWAALAGLLALAATPSVAATPSLLELVQKGTKHQGRLVAKGSDVCWLMGRDGRLSEFAIDEIDSVHTIAPRFREWSPAELRDQLRREMPRNFRIDATGRFIVCAEKDNRRYGEICEETYRMFHRYFSVRGFHVSEPEFPLVVVVFPDRPSFSAYCRKDGVAPASGMVGYYMRLTNRTALFDPADRASFSRTDRAPRRDLGEAFAAREDAAVSQLAGTAGRAGGATRPAGRLFDAVVEADLHDTLVHETVHQVAYNSGLHARLGDTPKWVVEGLATMFEAPGIRDAQRNASPKTRINRERYARFCNYAKNRRQPRSLESFVGRDDLFASSVLDAYAEAWALTFFLAETRHASYVRYLKATAQRDAFRRYTAAERVADFRQAFGDLKSVETDFLRFFEKLL
jgi:hypothetical protein